VSRVIFVTGTDTGVGKTLLTLLLLAHLRDAGVRALAMKPFCSGGTRDVDLIQGIQGPHPFRHDISPFQFDDPVAPLVAARKAGRRIQIGQVIRCVRKVQNQCECLIVEGAGGLLVPLGRDFSIADLVSGLRCETIVVGKNKLGTINHTLLTVEALQRRGVKGIKVVLMGQKHPDQSARSNAAMLREILENIDVIAIPYLGPGAPRSGSVKQSAKKIKKVLVRVLDFDIVCPRSTERGSKGRTKEFG
jgi:dethiobiotin synthetase